VARRSAGTLILPGGGHAGQRLRSAACDTRCQAAVQRDWCAAGQAVGGNTALALLLTVGTNLAGIFTMPFVLAAVLGGGGGGVAIAPQPLLAALVQTILVPLLAGAAARAFIPGARGVACMGVHMPRAASVDYRYFFWVPRCSRCAGVHARPPGCHS